MQRCGLRHRVKLLSIYGEIWHKKILTWYIQCYNNSVMTKNHSNVWIPLWWFLFRTHVWCGGILFLYFCWLRPFSLWQLDHYTTHCQLWMCSKLQTSIINLYMRPANGRRRYNVTPCLITQTPFSGSCCLPIGALQSMWATWCKIKWQIRHICW